METNYILSNYIEAAMSQAVYDKLEDNTYTGQIPECKGVISFSSTLHDCEQELHSVLEEWILLGLKMGHTLPAIAGIDLNRMPEYEPMDFLQKK